MDEFFPALLVVSLGGVLAFLQAVRVSRKDAPALLFSFAAHVFCGVMQVRVALALYGGGDFFSYSDVGGRLGRLLSMDFVHFAPEMLKLLFWQIPQMPIDTSDWGGATGSMMALSGFLSYATGGAIYTLCIAVAVWGYFGQVALYRGFRVLFPEAMHSRLLVATLLVPSSVYWSSALLKESVAITGMGYVFLGFVQYRRAFRFGSLAQIFGGAVVIALFKTYILFALVFAVGAWLYCERERGRTQGSAIVQFVLGATVAAAGLVLLSRIFPEFSLETFANRAAFYQGSVQDTRGGSDYSIGDSSRTTLGGQLAFAPVALVTSLYRPFPFEAKTAQVGVAAFESTLFVLLTIRAVARRTVRGAWRMVSTSPPLAFCTVFSLVFGVGVGLTTTNLGTLSRYRMPLIPFFIALLLVLDAPFFSPGPAIAGGPTKPPPPRARRVPSDRLPVGTQGQ